MIQALGRQTQADVCMLETSLVYIGSPRIARLHRETLTQNKQADRQIFWY